MTDKAQAAHDLSWLLSRVALGDRAAFAQLYQDTHRNLFGVACRVLGKRETAEEALQDAFVNIWHHAGNYRAAASQPMTWMVHIVRNRALDILRSEGKHPRRGARASLHDSEEGAVQIASVDPGPADLLDRATESLGIRRCMEALDPAHRQALALAYYQGLSQTEIAEAMGAPIGTVKSWVRRGLDRLRHCLEAAGVA